MSMGSSGGSGTGTSANVYEPAAQPQADLNWNTILQPLINQAESGGSPGQAYYPNAQQDYSLFGSGTQLGQNALAGANTASGYAPGIADQALGTGNDLHSLANVVANPAIANGITSSIFPAAGQVLNTAFDPQRALYNQQSTQALNQQNAINAMSGVAGTPYGAGVTGQNQQNFNNQWLNQQLGRETSGLQSAGSADVTGSGALGNLVSATAGAGQGSLGLGQGGMSTILSGAAQPYATSQGIANTDLSGLANLINVGNSQYQLPEQVLANLQSYLGLGQSASTIANSIDQTQNAQLNSIGSGIGTAASLGSGLLGGGAGAGAGAGADFIGGTLGAGSSLGAAGTDVALSSAGSGGAGSILSSLPLIGAGS